MPAPFVITGAGPAGAKAAEALREAGYGGGITLIGDEREPPYERPALSKRYLTGAQGGHKRQCLDVNGQIRRLVRSGEAVDKAKLADPGAPSDSLLSGGPGSEGG